MVPRAWMEKRLKLWAEAGHLGDGQNFGCSQAVSMEGTLEKAGGVVRSGREAGHVAREWNGGAEVASPEVASPDVD